MGDISKFTSPIFYYYFNLSFIGLLFSEFCICISSSGILHKTKTKSLKESKTAADHGSMWAIILAFWVCIYISTFFVSRIMPVSFRNLKFPGAVSAVGCTIIWIGILIRVTAVLALKKAFTYSVQTTDNQHLIQTGLYKYVRNPAYTGSILSLLGVSLAFRHILAPFVVLVIAMIGYNYRIHVEESALRKRFPEEFNTYSKNSWRLFPLIY